MELDRCLILHCKLNLIKFEIAKALLHLLDNDVLQLISLPLKLVLSFLSIIVTASLSHAQSCFSDRSSSSFSFETQVNNKIRANKINASLSYNSRLQYLNLKYRLTPL